MMILISQFNLRHRTAIVLLMVVVVYVVATVNRKSHTVDDINDTNSSHDKVLQYPVELTRVRQSSPRNTDVSESLLGAVGEVAEEVIDPTLKKNGIAEVEEDVSEASSAKKKERKPKGGSSDEKKTKISITKDVDSEPVDQELEKISNLKNGDSLVASVSEGVAEALQIPKKKKTKKTKKKKKTKKVKKVQNTVALEEEKLETTGKDEAVVNEKEEMALPSKSKEEETIDDEVKPKAEIEPESEIAKEVDENIEKSEAKAEDNFEVTEEDVHPDADEALSEAVMKKVLQKAKLIPDPLPKKNQVKFLNEIHNLKIFFRDVGRFFVDAKPLRDSYINGNAQSIQIDNDKLYISKEYLESILDIPTETVQKMKESHRRFVDEQIPKLFHLLDTFGGITRADPEWKTYEDSRGYVMVATGKYLWMSYLFIKQLRATGAVLPVEIFIPTSKDYDIRFCNNILPKYNASCTIYSAELEEELEETFGIGDKQKSILALLNSKFESVLYLDPEDIPVTNLDKIFNTKAFQENGLVLWPDVWSRTTNPAFYNIARVPITQKKIRFNSYDHADWKRKELDEMPGVDFYNFDNTHYHSFEGTMSDPTTQSGAFLINRTQHLKTLLLALYYHVLGDKFYYPLFSQGANDHPELEAIAAAAHVLEMPKFIVGRLFEWYGYTSTKDSQVKAKSYGHFDPDGKDELVFLHLKSPKLFPELLGATEDELMYTSGPTKGKHIRLFEHVNNKLGYDFDLRMFQFFTQAICANYYNPKTGRPVDKQPGVDKSEYMGSHIKYLGLNVIENKKLCTQIFIPHLQNLKETTEFPETLLKGKEGKEDKSESAETAAKIEGSENSESLDEVKNQKETGTAPIS